MARNPNALDEFFSKQILGVHSLGGLTVVCFAKRVLKKHAL